MGYAGGHWPSPTYEDVCSGRTGHAEVVQVEFDPDRVSYQQLLEQFFATHDPTSPNRQGLNRGEQYRSIILYHSPQQRDAAEALIARLSAEGRFGRPIVTQVVPLEKFWRAEEYHQRYYEKHGWLGCRTT